MPSHLSGSKAKQPRMVQVHSLPQPLLTMWRQKHKWSDWAPDNKQSQQTSRKHTIEVAHLGFCEGACTAVNR
eukprot:2595134-Amphidinium_carterae.1